MTELERAIRRDLARGTAATIEELAAWNGAPRRAVEEAIQALRLTGEPIIDAGRDGVRLTTDPDEVRAYVRRRRRRELTVARGTRALMHTANRLERTELTLGLA